MNNRLSVLEAIYAHFYRRRKSEAESKRTRYEQVRIVSVGNITTGGTGKTPATAWLVRRLQNEGFAVAVVGRGYGGELSAQGAVVSDGREVLLNAAQAGDEALLHARSLPGVPVVIGRDRVAAVQMAIEKFAPQVVVLDDGFQYWSLERDFDLVLLDARQPFGNGKLLPVGRLREPVTALARASAILLTRAEAANAVQLQDTRDAIRALTSAPIFVSNHAPHGVRSEAEGIVEALGSLRGRDVAALAALANNEPFFQALRQQGANVVKTMARRDHHPWREKELRDFVGEAAERYGAQIVVTTEKDAVKIKPEWCTPLPFFSVQIELQIENEAGLWQLVQSQLVSKHS